MSVIATPSIFDVFNARFLSPPEVARTFVPPSDHFLTLIKQANTLIVGPRGSGKTTLLKMLHPAALEAWSTSEADIYRDRVTYTGIFVPTDLNWSEQVRSLGAGRLDTPTRDLLTRAAFTTHLLMAVVESMKYRAGRQVARSDVSPYRRVALSPQDEADIVRLASVTLYLDKSLPTLSGLYEALGQRFSRIKELGASLARKQLQDRLRHLEEHAFVNIDFLAASSVLVRAFNERVGEPYGRWAFLFDELELAPEGIREQLFRMVRGTDQVFLFKLSISPYAIDLRQEFDSVDQPQQKQDYDRIRLWYENKDRGYVFCQALLSRLLSDRGIQVDTRAAPDVVFGRSAFGTRPSDWQQHHTAYHKTSPTMRRFIALRKIDPSFRDYLRRKGIRLGRVEALGGTERAKTLRKVTQIVALREYFRRSKQRRSRKVPLIYAGAECLFAMVEGNPRWFKGIVGPLLDHVTHENPRITDGAQVRAVLEAGHTFRAMLKTIPCPPVDSKARGLLSLLDPIGDVFAQAAIDKPFTADPPCTFIVDSLVDQGVEKALGRALNAGAIVYVPENDRDVTLTSLYGHRFRLSYLLAPHYYTPLLLGPARRLSQLLEATPKRTDVEPTLFSFMEEEEYEAEQSEPE